MTVSAHLVVRAGGRCCGLPLPAVRRVVRELTLHPVPASARRLLGLAQFGGEPLAVVDLATLIGEVAGHGGLTVVLDRRRGRGGAGLGLAVDAVLGVRRLGPPQGPCREASSAVVTGEVASADGPVLLLDAERILAGADGAEQADGDDKEPG